MTWLKPRFYILLVTVSLTLICSPIVGLDPEIPFYLAYANKLLANKEDLAIIAENGLEIKAHRNVVAAHSSVFGAMFQHNMVEARTGVLQLKDMSEESVRAFLEFLYTRKLKSADDNPLVCVDLLEAGHKYDIQPMENLMKNILLEKTDEWYTPESVLCLIIFVRNTKLEKLQKRANQLLYSMKNEVKSLATFRELCEENKMTETELFSYLAVPVSKFENDMLVKVTRCHSK